MSQRKAAPLTPCINSRPLQASMTLIAIVFLVLFNCVNLSSTSPVSSVTKQEAPNSVNKETLTEEDPQALGALSQPVKRAASRQYNFGIGKRDDDSTGLSKEDELLAAIKVLSQWSEIAEKQNEKRANPQRFSFGLGKRAMESDGQEEEVDGEKEVNSASEWQAPEKKKAERYNFGIGRRSSRASWFESLSRVPASHKKASNFEDFMKRRYSFGLGKRSV